MKKVGKNKMTHVIILLFIYSMTMGLGGCGRDAGAEDGAVSFEEDSSIEVLPRDNTAESKLDDLEEDGEEMGSGSEDGGQLEVKELDWITLEENLRPSILQITCGGYMGSGVVWEITEDEVRLASSGHLLKNGETCEAVCYAGIFYEAEVEQVLEDCDIGFAVIPAEALRADGVELTAVMPCLRGKDELVQGEELAVYGSMDYTAGNFVKGYLIDAEREIQLEGYEKAEGLLLGGIMQESGLVDAGMSGSGVFNKEGELIGILAGGDGRQGFAAVPVWKFM